MEGMIAPHVWQGSHHAAHRVIGNGMKDLRVTLYPCGAGALSCWESCPCLEDTPGSSRE